MPCLTTIPRSGQRAERWANGAGSTTVILREPDSRDWRIRISVARVDHEGPFSGLAATRRLLTPLDAPMTLRFADGGKRTVARHAVLRFDGAPPPTGLLPEGPTRDFNLMLRGDADGELIPRTLIGSMLLPCGPGVRWLVWLDTGHATLQADGQDSVALDPQDAVLAAPDAGASRCILEGSGEIVLARLYACG